MSYDFEYDRTNEQEILNKSSLVLLYSFGIYSGIGDYFFIIAIYVKHAKVMVRFVVSAVYVSVV